MSKGSKARCDRPQIRFTISFHYKAIIMTSIAELCRATTGAYLAQRLRLCVHESTFAFGLKLASN